MDEFGSIWSYPESVEELKQKLLCKTFELESVRTQANEEIRREKENVNQLLLYLKTAYKERDEARDQIKKILNGFTSFFPQNGFISSQTQMQPSKANSSITESNSFSDTYTNYKSPNDPFLDIVSSPDSSNLGYVNQQQQQNHPLLIDQSCLVIDSLAKGKPLPQKGKLLKAVLEAGPLLKTLLVAGSLPSWRNPPPIQASQIPPVSIRGCDSRIVNLGQENNNISSNLLSPQMFSPGSLMQFDGGLVFGGAHDSEYGLLGKRQKLQ